MNWWLTKAMMWTVGGAHSFLESHGIRNAELELCLSDTTSWAAGRADSVLERESCSPSGTMETIAERDCLETLRGRRGRIVTRDESF